ncbi:MAG: xanthine dehydrogenase accessory protein XdhC [Paracoccus sp. (in: a-proteobacteria)]|jgi:xanthine dehydrogenase accessory factor|uniref:xanthine dehydrogenase accessory protein XdhC n=2 Tax=Paracoccus TaxID=265 RepID=UPI000C5686A1|nr:MULTISPECIES: xanthine dehydrogenase accessory protein XdhC [unclassified Paracoccus (in: a-proteobacteria)]MAN57466.1 xanthine dehydrogenase accessory protein XdhC [Paracoccus sp. (in: a-proteobacteria)]MBA49411.1 xanthine dehydrogenase accessory protein XdhC [Paracoccus sp. (in: a-proteobacteria)]HIC65370.1 xanthine dehydrogenase accessory protein XdhC [Paracoccus sp. (in: a-proteobacteria)]|tara:strand:- start:1282 stop:2022 length:741 start_codon:yes stop_codon:yes gene_type:complete
MIRVRVIATSGSTPRDAGAEMIVEPHRVTGTIGGGQLEYMAIDRARQMIARSEESARMEVPLGPEIGQCCGGRVTLCLDREPSALEDHPDALIFGAGHVGRALALALQPLPVNVTLIDQRAPELAQAAPGIETRMSPLPEALIRAARPGSAVVILTHDHALDFLLAAEALSRDDLCYVGMIGSATKRARFSGFARKQGLDPAPLVCPIGAGLTRDKRPSVIAATTAAELIARLTATSSLNKYPCNS